MKISNTLSNHIADVVRDAISEDLDPKSFIREVQACWELESREKMQRDSKTFDDLLASRS